ncbi:zf-HC2 domain-containing protein [Micromonospora echinaurantiaca]|uniref:zf-HC2 domain-containing protein n=1 Tax=Micromonospora echinaurantiaca TaxID=47857 RepID=UPI00371D457B
MTDEVPCTYTTAIAALLLGALGPRERQDLEAHLRQCPTCLGELVFLAPLPGLLYRAAPPGSCPRWDP